MKGLIAIIVAFMLSICVAVAAEQPSTDVPRVTQEQLKSMLGEPDLILLDVRLEEQWKISASKIPGAVHENQAAVASWADKYPKDKTIVTY